MQRLELALGMLAIAASSAAADTHFVDGSFEAPDMQAWTLTKGAASPTFATIGILARGQTVSPGADVFDYADAMAIANYSDGLPFAAAPTDGARELLVLQNGPSTTAVSQIVTVPARGSLGFDLQLHNWASAFSADQRVRVIVRDATSDAELAVLFETNGDALVMPMTDEQLDLGTFAGQTVRVVFEVAAHEDFLDVALDNVRLESAPPPEPSPSASPAAAAPASPPEDPAALAADPQAGGCAAGGTASPAGVLLVLGLVLRRRGARKSRSSRCRG